MKSISSLALVAATLFVAVSNATDDNLPAQGCFSSTLGLKVAGTTDIYTSKGSCSKLCIANGSTVFGLTNSTWCYCGTTIPPVDTKVTNSSCNTGCPGFPADMCGGGSKYTSVYLTNDNLQGTVSNINDDGTTPSGTTITTPSHTASTTQSVVTVVNGQTVYVTPTATANGKSSSGGPSKAGIAAGVVVGLIAIAAIAGGVFVFLRNKQRREVEEEYRRNAAINQFTQGGKHPSSSAGASTLSDMRLDPAVMAQRRMSDGSIADNQDYSRRILKVTNA